MIEHYDEISYWRNRSARTGTANTTPGAGINQQERDIILKYCPTDSKVMDYGCGEGRLMPLYTKLNCTEVVGVDIAYYDNLLSSCSKDPNKNFRFVMQDAPVPDFLNYNENHFDCVVSLSVLSHVKPENIQKTVWQLARVAPLLIISAYNHTDKLPDSPGTYMFQHNYDQVFINAELKEIEYVQMNKMGIWVLEKQI